MKLFNQRNKILVGLLVLSAANFTIFQNCSKTNFAQSSVVGGQAAGEITINNDDKFTINSNVFVQLHPDKSSLETIMEYALFDDENCTTEPKWKKFVDVAPYKLSEPMTDGTKTISVIYKYKNLKEESGYKLGACVKDTIVLDTTKPVVNISGLKEFTNSTSAQAQINVDETNDIESLVCSLDNVSEYKSCPNIVSLSQLAEGKHVLYAKAKDKAGNESEVAQKSWVVDTIKPMVQYLTFPAEGTTNLSADFSYRATDVGTGVQEIKCLLDGKDVACLTNAFKQVISVGGHSFQVLAADKAGNISDTPSYNWNVKTPVGLGDFEVQGVSPLGSTTYNSEWLISSVNPKIHNSVSTFATIYNYSIINSAGTTVCTAQVNIENSNSLDLAQCGLQDKQSYRAKVIAQISSTNKDQYGTVVNPKTHERSFRVDASGPQVTAAKLAQAIVPPFGDGARFSFSATDISGIKSITCFRKGPSNVVVSESCTGQNQITYNGLEVGTHQFYIQATDNNNQTALLPYTVNFDIQPDCGSDETYDDVKKKCVRFQCHSYQELSIGAGGQLNVPARNYERVPAVGGELGGVCYFTKVINALTTGRHDRTNLELFSANHGVDKASSGRYETNIKPKNLGSIDLNLYLNSRRALKLAGSDTDINAFIDVDNYLLIRMKGDSYVRAYGSRDSSYHDENKNDYSDYVLYNNEQVRLTYRFDNIDYIGGRVHISPLEITGIIQEKSWSDFHINMNDCGGGQELGDVYLHFQ